MIRPESKELGEREKQRVLELLRERDITCGSCGSSDFEIGEALYLGFLFLDEDTDVYMVALTCKAPGCCIPRTGIKLHSPELFGEAGR